jgi:hypothetical protein
VTVVNLNKARKLRQRAESKATAASNRVKHGRPLPKPNWNDNASNN